MATKRKHKGRKGQAVLSNQGRKVTATTRVSTRAGFAAPHNVLATPYSQDQSKMYAAMHKPLAEYDADGHLLVPSFGDKAANAQIAGLDRAQTKQAAWGGKCGTCYMVRSRTGKCDCNA